MIDGPLVSILTPSYNQGDFINSNLVSVASQTYTRLEHIVMDGGSNDATVQILSLASSADPRVKWRSEPDHGQADALNKAFAASEGSIIGWINSDDAYMSETVVAKVVQFFESNPSADVVYGHGAWAAADGSILLLRRVPRFSHARLKTRDFIIQPSAFFRRSCIGSRFVDEDLQFAMDYELWLRLAEEGRAFSRIDEIIAIDREHGARKTGLLVDEYARNHRYLRERYGIDYGGRWHSLAQRLRGWGGRVSGLSLLGKLPPTAVYGGSGISKSSVLLRHLAMRGSALRGQARRQVDR